MYSMRQTRASSKTSPFDGIFTSEPHIAEKIVKFIDRKFRMKKLSHVSRGFYEAVSRVDKKQYKMKIEGDKDVSFTILNARV